MSFTWILVRFSACIWSICSKLKIVFRRLCTETLHVASQLWKQFAFDRRLYPIAIKLYIYMYICVNMGKYTSNLYFLYYLAISSHMWVWTEIIYIFLIRNVSKIMWQVNAGGQVTFACPHPPIRPSAGENSPPLLFIKDDGLKSDNTRGGSAAVWVLLIRMMKYAALPRSPNTAVACGGDGTENQVWRETGGSQILML